MRRCPLLPPGARVPGTREKRIFLDKDGFLTGSVLTKRCADSNMIVKAYIPKYGRGEQI